MKTKYLLLIVVLVGVFTILMFPQTFARSIVEPMTTEQVLENFDLIILGTIVKAGEPEDGKPLEFQIEIEEIIKKPDLINHNTKTIDAIGCTPNKRISGFSCPFYDVGERGLFLLSDSDQGYEISFRSQTSKIHCTSEQFLENYKEFRMGLFWNQTENRGYSIVKYHFTGEPTKFYYTMMNPDMKQKDYSIKFNARTGETAFTDIVNGTIAECMNHVTVSTTFVPTIMGRYGFFAGPNDGTGAGMGSTGTPIIDFGASPKEQRDAGINGGDTWCNEGLYLVLKNDNTPKRTYDNYSACVTADTAEKLVQRNWGFVLS